MLCGVSTSCFYPQETLLSLKDVTTLNIQCTEIFFNTFCEIELPYVSRLCDVSAAANIPVVSVHPFSSNMEPFFFANQYKGRFDDGAKLYKNIFTAAQKLGAKIVVYHGDYKDSLFEFKQYCLNYKKLREIANDYGITLCQENVVRCKCGTDTAIKEMREILHDDVEFVFDMKQARRSGVSMQKMMAAMQGRIAHVHVSDYSNRCDCSLPGTGCADFAKLFDILKKDNYNGCIVVELYRNGFEDKHQLQTSVDFLKKKMLF